MKTRLFHVISILRLLIVYEDSYMFVLSCGLNEILILI